MGAFTNINSNNLDYDTFPDEECQIDKENNGISVEPQKNAHEELCADLNNALSIKLVGGYHALNYLRNKLQQKWVPKSQWQLIHLPNGYFVARFQDPDNRLFVLTRGPWMIGGQYLIMQKWKPLFFVQLRNKSKP